MFSDILKQLIQDKGITAYQLARDTGIADSLISNWKSGRQLPKYDSLNLLADYFDVSGDYLLGRTDNPKPYFLDGSVIKNNPYLMKMYKLLPLYPSADYVSPRARFLSPEGIKEVAVRRNESTEKADFIVYFQSDRMKPIYNNGDFLLIEKTDYINTGEVGVFITNKTHAFILKKEKDVLAFANPYYSPITIDENVYCAGRVIGTIDSSALFFTAMDK